VLLDEAGYGYVTGRYGREARFGDERSEVTLEADGIADIFMACYDRAGDLLGALRVGGHGPTVDSHWTIVLDELGNRYLVAGAGQIVKVLPAAGATDLPSTQGSPLPASSDAVVDGITNPHSRFDSISRNPDGSIQIVLEGCRNGTYVVEASVDLNTWTPVSTNRVRGGRILIEDRQAAELPMRFYRVRQP
jgi:hypothetical protein